MSADCQKTGRHIYIKNSSALSSNLNNSMLWHRRLGHIGESGLQKLIKAKLINGLDLKEKSFGFCDVCVEGKQCREPFNDSRTRAKRVLERIH